MCMPLIADVATTFSILSADVVQQFPLLMDCGRTLYEGVGSFLFSSSNSGVNCDLLEDTFCRTFYSRKLAAHFRGRIATVRRWDCEGKPSG
jgi:hypothetical protein